MCGYYTALQLPAGLPKNRLAGVLSARVLLVGAVYDARAKQPNPYSLLANWEIRRSAVARSGRRGKLALWIRLIIALNPLGTFVPFCLAEQRNSQPKRQGSNPMVKLFVLVGLFVSVSANATLFGRVASTGCNHNKQQTLIRRSFQRALNWAWYVSRQRIKPHTDSMLYTPM
ncbi:MAG: hypothetical protein ACI9NT_002899, partial [Bacteroidia bacterium]